MSPEVLAHDHCTSHLQHPRHHSQWLSRSGEDHAANHILTNLRGVKTAVLVNEFGEIGIDNDLIVTTDDMVELSNGYLLLDQRRADGGGGTGD